LASLAKRDQVPRATKAAQLVRQAMEIEEDFALSQLAMERDVPGAEWMSSEEFWKAAFKKAKKRLKWQLEGFIKTFKQGEHVSKMRGVKKDGKDVVRYGNRRWLIHDSNTPSDQRCGRYLAS
jgi:hypothetical protein